MADQQSPIEQHHQVLVVQFGRVDPNQPERRKHRQVVFRLDNQRYRFGHPHRLAYRRHIDDQHVLFTARLEYRHRSGQCRRLLGLFGGCGGGRSVEGRQWYLWPDLLNKPLDEFAVESPLDPLGRLRREVPGGVESLELLRHQVDGVLGVLFGNSQFVTDLPQRGLGRINLLALAGNQVDRCRLIVGSRLHQQPRDHAWNRLERQRFGILGRDDVAVDQVIHPRRAPLLRLPLVNADKTFRGIQIREPFGDVLDFEPAIDHLHRVITLSHLQQLCQGVTLFSQSGVFGQPGRLHQDLGSRQRLPRPRQAQSLVELEAEVLRVLLGQSLVPLGRLTPTTASGDSLGVLTPGLVQRVNAAKRIRNLAAAVEFGQPHENRLLLVGQRGRLQRQHQVLTRGHQFPLHPHPGRNAQGQVAGHVRPNQHAPSQRPLDVLTGLPVTDLRETDHRHQGQGKTVFRILGHHCRQFAMGALEVPTVKQQSPASGPHPRILGMLAAELVESVERHPRLVVLLKLQHPLHVVGEFTTTELQFAATAAGTRVVEIQGHTGERIAPRGWVPKNRPSSK